MKKIGFMLFVCFSFYSIKATENQTYPITISVFNNGTMLPGVGYAGVFSKTIHPGISLGTSYLYNKNDKHELFQTLKLAYFYHQFSQNAIQMYSEFGYQQNFTNSFYGQSLLGVGYLHSFVNLEQFKLVDGEYQQSGKFGRPQFMGTFSVLLGYDFEQKYQLPINLFLQYQFWIQSPFVNKYVPVLPNSAVHLGAKLSLNLKSNN